jgi:SAM-dependent methyltransferase
MNSHNLAAIETEIRTLHTGLGVQTTVQRAYRLGQLLLAGKKRVGHGKYIFWHKSLGIRRSTAHVYVAIFKAGPSNVQNSGHLTIADALVIIRNGRKRISREEAAAQIKNAMRPCIDPAIRCGDSLAWLQKQKTGSIPFFISDPPYGVGIQFDGWRDKDNAKDYWTWFEPFWREMQRVLQPGGIILLFQSYLYTQLLFDWYGKDIKLIASCQIVRAVRSWEPIAKWCKPGQKPLIPDMSYNDFTPPASHFTGEFSASPDVHPCPKPVIVCRYLVNRYTLPGCLVVDPFCGIGSIPLACKLEGRGYVGIDRSEMYCKIARHRLAKVTGTEHKEAG